MSSTTKIILKGTRDIFATNQMIMMKKRMQKVAVFWLFILDNNDTRIMTMEEVIFIVFQLVIF